MSETLAGPVGEIREASASTGTALTTTAAFIQLPDGSHYLSMTPRNFSTAVVARFAMNPYLIVLKTTDALVAAANLTDYSQNAQDGSTSTDVTLSSLSTAANSDFLYVGSHLPFRGVAIDVDGPNANASVLTVKYWKSDSTWADITASDGTDDTGKSLGVDGNVTWTVPTDWAAAALNSFGEYTAADSLISSIKDTSLTFRYSTTKLYWTRWQWSAALDSAVTLNSMLAMNRSTAYAELVSGQSWEQAILKGPMGYGCIEALTDAGTANLVVDVSSHIGAKFI